MNNTVLILGPTSAIARATAMALAKQRYNIYLAGRDLEEIKHIATDLTIRYNIKVFQGHFDAEKIDSHQKFFQKALTETGGLAGVVLAFGYMSDSQTMRELKQLQKIITINFTSAAAILNICANYFESQKSGFIIGITSVAGDRGRQSNYPYGAAKGALSLFLQGLRNRLAPHQVRVITIKPGFVDTAMTFGLPGLFLVAEPEKVGTVIANTLRKKQDVVYVPWFWRYIMLIIKSIPESIFKRMKL